MASPGEKVYEILRGRILDQVYVPSQSLIESALAEELGVSRNTVKKALMRLVNEKLVEIKANKSAIVKSLSIEEAVHLFEIRERLEGLIAYSATTAITEDELDAIKNNVDQMKKYIDNGKLKEYSATNDVIHHIIYKACPNKQAVEMIESIRLQLRRYNKRTILISGRSIDSYNEHLKIYNAILSRDPEKAENEMRKHVASVREVLKENYSVLF